MTDVLIKPMETEEEILGKAFVHWRTWQIAYAGLIPDRYLSDPAFRERCEKNARRWTDGILVAKRGDDVIGFTGFGTAQDDDLGEAGEVYALYVLPEYWSRGVGYALMKAAAEALRDKARISLWVLDGNERAIRFYKRLGFRFDGAEKNLTLGEERRVKRMILERRPCGPF